MFLVIFGCSTLLNTIKEKRTFDFEEFSVNVFQVHRK